MKEVKRKPDMILLYVTLILVAIGLVMVLSASSYDAMVNFGDSHYFFIRQLAWCMIGLVGMFVMSKLPVEWIKKISPMGALAIVLVLGLVWVFGTDAGGARRSFAVGAQQISPAELAKPIYIVFFAYYLSLTSGKIRSWKGYIFSLGVLAVPVLLIVKEDLGTAFALAVALFCMLLVAGINLKEFLVTVGLGVTAIAGFIAMEPYRVKRFFGFLDPFADASGTGWQVVQSYYALGSGGLFGVGLGNSRQKMLYLPERHTDFIFAIIGEELGLIGAAIVVILFCVLIWRGCSVALNMENEFMSYCALGLTAMVGGQAFINIGVVVGLLPVTGITLPFISYGGSSLVCMMATIGFLLNLSCYSGVRNKKVK